MGAMYVIQEREAPCINISDTNSNHELEKLLDRIKYVARSCKEIRNKYHVYDDGLYYLISSRGVLYQTFCDMTTAGGGWTLVASVHENNLYGKCTVGDRWSSQQGSNPNQPEGDGTWANTVTFGAAEAATSDDYKNPGYFDIVAQDVSVWHVPNNVQLEHWTTASILRYHTENRFLTLHGGNLFNLFMKFPVRFGIGTCNINNGPAIPIMYDTGDATSTRNLYGPHSRATVQSIIRKWKEYGTTSTMSRSGRPSKVDDRAKITLIREATRRPKATLKDLQGFMAWFCIGGGGHFPEGAPRQCGDFTSFDWDGYGINAGWSASREITEAATVFLIKIFLSFSLSLWFCDAKSMGAMYVIQEREAPCINISDTNSNHELEKLLDRVKYVARSCKEIHDKYHVYDDGLYYLISSRGVLYQTFCDMTTAGGGWTLVASVHENNMYGKCTVVSRAMTQTGLKLERWTTASILRYHTENRFLTLHGGNLFSLFMKFPVRFGIGTCSINNGPAIPIVYDTGDAISTKNLYGPDVREIFEPGFITFRVFNTEKAAMALCSGVKPKTCHTEHFCIGGGGYFPEAAPRQCGDFTSFDWSGYGTNSGASASREMTEAAVLLFYR
ncbi:Intelectin [Labeo rohita]|uniref:Intelectin n=1 Tax=Labeo rohita TaxID=84645 RepID=A0ABQ8MJ83_LABRO|nr:Intelectin [Labeo rohita]